MRLIGEEGSQIGIIDTRDAQQMADEKGLDLVEVAPNANPPVCRLMDYGKFRYEQSKKEREARKNQKQTELKEVRLKPKTSEHDLTVKAKQARRFLQAGDKVKFTVRFRGRELAHTNIGREMLDHIVEQLTDIAIVEQKPALESRALSVTLAPNAKVMKAAQQAVRDHNKRNRSEKQRRQQEDDLPDEHKRQGDAVEDDDAVVAYDDDDMDDADDMHDAEDDFDHDDDEHDDDFEDDADDFDHDDDEHDDFEHDDDDDDEPEPPDAQKPDRRQARK